MVDTILTQSYLHLVSTGRPDCLGSQVMPSIDGESDPTPARKASRHPRHSYLETKLRGRRAHHCIFFIDTAICLVDSYREESSSKKLPILFFFIDFE